MVEAHLRRLTLTLVCAAWLAAQPARQPPGVVIDWSPASSGRYIGSPSLAILPNGTYVATHDFFGPRSGSDRSATTRVFESRDRGRQWTHLTDLQGAFWGTLFVHRGALYWIGTHHEYGDALIRKSTDGGHTWTSAVLLAGRYHCAPQPVLVHHGRIWRAMEDAEGGGGWGKHFRAFMLSAPANSDLLQASSWVASNRIGRDASWLSGNFNGWLEGNAVATRKGHIVDVLRVDTAREERVALISISDDGRTATFDPSSGFIPFPGGAKKFTIRWDPVRKLYWALTNPVLPEWKDRPASSVRNTLALVSSSDLRSWTTREILLTHPDVTRHAFQYADWQFDGNTLAAVVRTAFDDPQGGAASAHDANYLMFIRVKLPPR